MIDSIQTWMTDNKQTDQILRPANADLLFSGLKDQIRGIYLGLSVIPQFTSSLKFTLTVLKSLTKLATSRPLTATILL